MQNKDEQAEPPARGNRKQVIAEQEELVQDDAVVGVFFFRSLMVFAALGLIAAVIYLATRESASIQAVQQTELSGPEQAGVDAKEPSPPKIAFADVTAAAGITFSHVNGAYGEKLLPETMGGGVAVFDYDNDGLQDVFFVNGRYWPWQEGNVPTHHALFRNLGNFQFEDVTANLNLGEAAYGMGVAVADYDGDGFTDLFITNVGVNQLYRNNAGQSFELVRGALEGDASDWSTSAAFFDMDNDGDLDVFVCNYVQWSREIDFEVDYQLTGIGRAYGPPTNYGGSQSRLYRNDKGSFVEVSEAAGINVANSATGRAEGKALAVKPIDLNGDGYLDLVVANDTVRNFVFMNQQDGSFEESGAIMGLAFDNSGSATGAMGVDSSFINNNQDVAIAIGNFANEMTSFYVAQGGELYTDESIVSGIGPDSRRALTFGVFFFDADLDGREELLAANGHVESDINIVQPSQHHAQATQLFWNCGPRCKRPFRRLEEELTGDLGKPIVGRGAAYADFDGDGDLDVVLTQAGGDPLLLRNDVASDNHWITLTLKSASATNRAAIGVLIEVEANGIVQRRTVMPTRSYLSQVPAQVSFGLAAAETVLVRVHWASDEVIEYKDLAIDESHTIAY